MTTPDSWPAVDDAPPCAHVRIDTEDDRTRVEVVPPGQRGVVIAAAVLPVLLGAGGLVAGVLLGMAGPGGTSMVVGAGLAVAAVAGALAIRSLLGRQALQWCLDADGIEVRRPGGAREHVAWSDIARVSLVDEVRAGGSQSRRVRALEFHDGQGRRRLAIAHTTRHVDHDRRVLLDLAGRCRAAGWGAQTAWPAV